MPKLKQELNANLVGANCVRPHFEEMTLKDQKGITLIALIITIIVMLILVGVTINVALNGELFEKGEKAAFQTEASTVKEELEMAKALKVMNAEGKPVEDYSDITLDLTNLDAKTKSKYASKIVVNKNGEICYNPANVTEQEKTWLEEIGISEYVNILKIQYFGGILTESDGTELELVYAIDYENKVMKCYGGIRGEKIPYLDTKNLSEVILNYDKEFYVLENGKQIDIGTGAIKIVEEEWPEYNHFIINGKWYNDVFEGEETIGIPLLINFDTSRLGEE